jgi:hypothetical protein
MKTRIRNIILLSITIVLANCNSADNTQKSKITPDTVMQIVTVDTFVALQKDTADNKLIFAGHPISFYLSHRQIPQVCKDIYNKKRLISDDNEVLALIDSIFTPNNETRPFYFLTLTQTMEKADGAYAEPLGIMGKDFVEKRTKEFLNYFINEPMLTNEDFDEWVSTVVGEIQISAEGHEKKEADNVKKKMFANCSDCNEQQKLKLENFTKQIKNHYP